MADVTPSGMAATIGVAKAADKDSYVTAFLGLKLTDFDHDTNPVTNEGEAPEIGDARIDAAAIERLGFEAGTLTMSGKFRTENQGHLLQLYGCQVQSGGFIVWPGVNETISVTDAGGGPTEVDLIDDSTAVAGTAYSGTEFAALLQVALNAIMTQVWTVVYSTTTKKFTIGCDGATCSLHWTTTPMMANLLGYEEGADDTGSLSYEGDEAREAVGSIQFRDGDNEVLRVTDNGGGPEDCDILADTGAILSARVPYNPWNVCAGLKAILDANTTLDGAYTCTYDADTNLYTISTDSVSLDLHHSHANSTMSAELGYSTAADDTGSTSYTSDTALLKAPKFLFSPFSLGDTFPYGNVLCKYESNAWLDLVFRGVRINELTFNGEARSNLTVDATGTALTWQEASGSETVTAERSEVSTPNTDNVEGWIKTDDTDIRIAGATWTFGWDPLEEPQLTEGEPYNVDPTNRIVSATFDIYMGSEEGDTYKKAIFGGVSGTSPSTTVVETTADVFFASGQTVTGQVGSTDKYGWRFEADRAQWTDYTPPLSGGDLEHGDLALNMVRDTSNEWYLTLTNGAEYGHYD